MAKRTKKKNPTSKNVNPHDAFFKSTFSYPEVVRSYIEKFMDESLVKHLDLDGLELDNNSFITPKLEEFYSDLVWKTRYKTTEIKISFLFEHKSYPVPYPHVQLLRYILEHLEQQIKAKEPLTVIIPIIIYHGSNEWQVRQFWEYFEGVDDVLKAFIPIFQYQLTDLSRYSDAELIEKGIGKLLNVFLAMIHVRDVKYILENYETIFIFAKEKDLQDARLGNLFHSIFVYLFKYIELNDNQMEQISTNIHEPLKKFTMSAYDLLIEKGIEKGMNLGIEKGELKKVREVVLSLLAKCPTWSDAEIAEVANTTLANVALIRKEITIQN